MGTHAPRIRSFLMTVRLPTFLGGFINPFDLKASDVDLRDIAYGLAHTYRYGGHMHPGITVAEHSVLVSRLVEAHHPSHPHLEALKRAALLHDASEAYLHDIQAPLRPFVFVQEPGEDPLPWSELDLRLTVIVCEALGVDPMLLTAPELVAADKESVLFEVARSKNLQHLIPGASYPSHLAHLAPRFLTPSEAQVHFMHRASEIRLLGETLDVDGFPAPQPRRA
jgi:hypothetical protein